MNTKSSERSWLLYRGVTMRRNDSCNFRICEYPPIKICCLYQNERVIIRQKISNKGWGYHESVRGDTINRCVGVPWIGIYNKGFKPFDNFWKVCIFWSNAIYGANLYKLYEYSYFV